MTHMNDMHAQERSVSDTLMAMVAVGDNAAARDYLAQHLDSFSPEVRKEIAFAMFTEGIQDEAAMHAFVLELQKQGLAAAEALGKGDGAAETPAAD